MNDQLGKPSRVRHLVLALLVLHYANTYMDRVCIAAVAPAIRAEFGLSHVSMGVVFTAFSISYCLFQLPAGRLADRLGPRSVLTGIVCFWSFFTAATAFAWNRSSLIVVRFLFGLGEAGAFPAATRAISRWFSASERGFVQGVTHTGSRLGGAITPPLAAYLMLQWNWRVPFVAMGAIGIIWAFFWFRCFREHPEDHPSVNQAELSLIRGGTIPKKFNAGDRSSLPVDWKLLLSNGNLWLLSIMYFCYAYTFWIYISWFPTYLIEERKFEPGTAGLIAGLILLAGGITNGLGGWISDRLVQWKGLRFGRRVVAISGFVVCIACSIPAVLLSDPIQSVAFFVVMVGALECTTGVSWAVAVDIGRDSAGTVSGMMNTFGNLGGVLSPLIFGFLVETTGSWSAPFGIAGLFCVVAALCWIRIDPEDCLATL